MKCRVCGQKMNFEEKIDECMAEYFELKKYNFDVKNKTVKLYKCPECTHLQIENLLSNDYYDKYGEFGGANQYYSSLDLNSAKINKLYSYLNKKNDFDKLSLLDIGCGCGKNLKYANDLFDKAVGVDASKISCEICEKKGLQVINGYFNAKLDIKEKFTSFMSTMLFEHLDSLYEVLDYAYKILEYGGIGLINVPNGQLIKKNNLYHQIIVEHINYFTPFSLSVMAKKCGFEIIKVEAIDETMELDLYVSKCKRDKTFNEVREFQRLKLKELLIGSKNISVWGAGCKSFKYIRVLPKDLKINHIIDSSKEKVGKYISGINIPIESITQQIINESDTIIIFASSYNNEIIEDLQEKYNFNGKIIYFECESVKKI